MTRKQKTKSVTSWLAEDCCLAAWTGNSAGCQAETECLPRALKVSDPGRGVGVKYGTSCGFICTVPLEEANVCHQFNKLAYAALEEIL